MDYLTLGAMVMGVLLCNALVLFFLGVGMLWTQIVVGYMLKQHAEEKGIVGVTTPSISEIPTGPRQKISREGSSASSEDEASSEADEWQDLFNLT